MLAVDTLGTLAYKNTPTPLWVFLYLYEKAQKESYISYMAGAKELAAFLAPIEVPIIESPHKIPEMLYSYETRELSKVLKIDEDTIIHTALNIRDRL